MKRAQRTIFTAAIAFVVWAFPAAAIEGFRIEPVGDRQGLSAGIVSTVYVDHTGLLWAATGRGLVRFDGYSVQVFGRAPSDPTTLSDNIVRRIHEDRSGHMWIGTLSGGLNLFDRATGTFTHYRHDPADPASLSHDTVLAVLEDREGSLWVGTEGGLNRFDAATGGFERLLADPADPGRPSGDIISAIHEDESGALWIATSAGLNRRDPATGQFARYRHDPGDPHSLDDDVVFAIAEDPQGVLWVGTRLGLQRLEPGGTTFRRYTDAFRSHGGPMMVSALASGPDGTVWVGTFDRGLLALTVETGELTARREPDEKASAPARVLALDTSSDAVYAATWGGGLQRVRFDAVPVETVRPDTDPGALRDVSAILEDDDGTLWLGVYGAGLRSCSRDGQECRAIDAPGREIYAVAEGRPDIVWYGGVEGLGRIDRSTGETSFFTHDPADPRSIGAGFVAALLEDSDGRLWVGTSAGGVQRIRGDGRSFERFSHEPDDPSSLSHDYVTVLVEDSSGTLWVGTSGGGLNACGRRDFRCKRYEPDPEDLRALDSPDVSAILEDRRGRFWIGTAGGGISRLEDDGFHRVTGPDGLPDDGVRGMVEDDDGSVWISTRNGLVRYDPETNRAMCLGLAEGLPSLDFFHGAATHGREHLYFGTPKGLVALPSGTPFPDPRRSPAVFTSIRTLPGPLQVDRPVPAIDLLRVAYGQVLSFEFAVLDFDAEQRHRYEYRLAGVADDWVDLGAQRDITFTDLGPGSYTVEVRGRNARGVWSERSLELQVVPPFWMTWWFRLGAVVLVVVGTVTAYRTHVSRLERRNRELEGLNRDLRSLTLRLEAAEEEERRRLARELHDEMGQMLSAAKISLQSLPTLPDESARNRQLERTVGLVNKLLAQVRALSLDLSPPFLDELGLGLTLQGYLEQVGERAGVDVQVEVPADLRIDDRATTISVFRLVQESTTNIARHADASRVHVHVSSSNGWLAASIRDDGQGFDVEEALQRSRRGRHLGLLGMRDRVQSLGGELAIDSQPGSGTEIRFRLPLTRAIREGSS